MKSIKKNMLAWTDGLCHLFSSTDINVDIIDVRFKVGTGFTEFSNKRNFPREPWLIGNLRTKIWIDLKEKANANEKH